MLPGFDVTLRDELLVVRGTVIPSPITQAYRVRIEYREGKTPDVFVEEPQLSRRPREPDKPIPHTYDSGTPGKERPCCFYPAVDWDGTRHIATTVIPWLMSWLFDYEIWYATGEWHGGGVHPSTKGVSKRLLKRQKAEK